MLGKITTQVAAVIIVGVLGFTGLILGLAVWADWSDGAIVAMCTAFGALLINTIVSVRNQVQTRETLVDQTNQLDQVIRQTNGLSEAERQDIADQAADRAAVKIIKAYREGGLR